MKSAMLPVVVWSSVSSELDWRRDHALHWFSKS